MPKLDASQITITISIRNLWKIKLGALFVRIGCRIAGFTYVEENIDTGKVTVDMK